MKFGRMDARITIQRATVVTNDYGERVPTWATLATVWADVIWREGSGAERIASDQILSKQPVHFLIRYSTTVSSVSAKDRVSYGSKSYEIETIQEIGRNDGLRLTCTLRE
jgi:SPP1 family predicted phage head-tail adaptor